MEIDLKDLSTRERYQLLTSSLLPRPIAFVSTQNLEGQNNLAPFSFFNGVSSNPPCLSISIARNRRGEKKDTLRNIEETKEFVVNTAHLAMGEALVDTAAEFPYGESEIEACGFSTTPSQKVRPPRIAEALLHYECRLYKAIEVGDGTPGSSTLVIGEILHMHLSDAILEEGKIQLEALKPLSRLSAHDFGSSEFLFSKPIPSLKSSPKK